MKEDLYFYMKEDYDIFMIYELHIFIFMNKYSNIIIFWKQENDSPASKPPPGDVHVISCVGTIFYC